MRASRMFAVKILVRILVSAVLCLVVTEAASAQQTPPAGTSPSSPIQIISNAQFNQMVQSGQLKVISPGVLLIQNLERLFADFKNQLVVDDFLFHNPNLTGVQQLVRAVPNSPNVSPTVDGNYRAAIIDNSGLLETIETNGQGTKLATLADSIITSSDPVRQLALYQSAYTQYTSLYNQICNTSPAGAVPSDAIVSPDGCANLISPSALTNPSGLQNATLGTIQNALTALGAQGFGILHIVPLPLGGLGVPCSEEIGASSTPGVNSSFGDQTRSAGITPFSSGIVANFNFVNKNLLSCIKNQGARGTCHIFAATSAIEELIARDKGLMVNLSEQDFMENLKLLWAPSYYGDSGGTGFDVQTAAANSYKFAYENQWDYNPSLSQPGPPAYEYQNSCLNYPYPSLEAGCSDSAPQANAYCTYTSGFSGVLRVCGFLPAFLSGSSPYSATGANNIWNPANTELSVEYIYLALAFNNAVIMDFNATDNFAYDAPGGYIQYSAADNMTSYGGHAVHIVGFVSNADLAANPNTASQTPGSGGGYFIIKNSWGEMFGDAGYFYMPVDYLKANAGGVFVVSSVND